MNLPPKKQVICGFWTAAHKTFFFWNIAHKLPFVFSRPY